jgi:hypothetical protein
VYVGNGKPLDVYEAVFLFLGMTGVENLEDL